jgi:lysozyme family protein
LATFELAIPVVLRHEGGLVDNPNDPGGITDYGISLRYLKTLGHDGDFDHDGVVGPNDIKVLTKDQACHIYQHYWWDRYQYGLFNCQNVATKTFDMAVNMGAVAAHKILQRALGTANVDGIIGPETIRLVNNASTKLLDSMENQQAQYYKNLALSNPKFDEFLRGWLKRAYDRIGYQTSA